MQKIVTIAIDTTQLKAGKATPFSVTELDEINEVLELGWQIEDWDFLKECDANGQVILLVTLNDDLVYADDGEDFNTEFEVDDDEDYNDEPDSLKNKKN